MRPTTKNILLTYAVFMMLIGALACWCGCPPMSRQIRQAQQQTEKTDGCHDFVMPAPSSFIGDQCPRTDHRAEISGGFVVCRCKPVVADGGL